MKILLYCPVFYPMVGGMETVTEEMGNLFTKAGHECILITPIKHHLPDHYSFKVYRSPDLLTKLKLIVWSEVVVSKGASLALLPFSKLLLKPFVWIHSGYQASCVDGLGWVDGFAAPMNPIESLKFHYKRKGLFYIIKEAFKLYVRRFSSKHLVTMNVAVSDWVAMRQPFKKQVRIYNPFPIHRFRSSESNSRKEYDFVYLGRLVSEKGVANLIEAFGLVCSKHPDKALTLLIIGDGDWRERLEKLVSKLDLTKKILFTGRKTGRELVELVHKSNIAVIPSEWEEPMGGVALELLAAQKNIIVSKNGGLAECVGNAGLLFPNGNSEALAECMTQLLEDKRLSDQLHKNAKEQIKKFAPELLIEEYIQLLNKILKKK